MNWTEEFISQVLADIPAGRYRKRTEKELRDHMETLRQSRAASRRKRPRCPFRRAARLFFYRDRIKTPARMAATPTSFRRVTRSPKKAADRAMDQI